MTAGARSPLVIASNRGPVAFARAADGTLQEKRGVGGLVTAVQGAVRGRAATWIAAALTDADRTRAAEGTFPIPLPAAEGGVLRVGLLDIAEDAYDGYYNDFSNRVLWFLHHYLWETARQPAFGPTEAIAWDSYRAVNQVFADRIAEEAPSGAIALPQDYHLCLVPAMLRDKRPDLAIGQFWHIPFAAPDQYRVLPDRWGTPLLEGLLAADLIGFHTERWATNFLACCKEVLGARVRGHTVTHAGHTTRVGVHPIGVNVETLSAQAHEPRVEENLAAIEELTAGRTLIVRVDRTDLSKNILRGFLAYEILLERRPDLRGRVTHLALFTPSRRNVPEYAEYLTACTMTAERINERFGDSAWQPIVVEISDDFPRTLAAYRRYDVLLVNPVYDGMNLVAREGPLVNERDGVLVLSRNAGAAAGIGDAALVVNPFDPEATASALEDAIDMDAAERARRGALLRERAQGIPPRRWLGGQIRALRR